MGLEEQLYGSKTIRDYLKLFSTQQWNRVSKATVMLGIQYLTKITNGDLRQLSVQKIEDIVVDLAVAETLQYPPPSAQSGKKDKNHKKEKKQKRRHNNMEMSKNSIAESSILDASQLNQSSSSSLPIASQVLLHSKQQQQSQPPSKVHEYQPVAVPKKDLQNNNHEQQMHKAVRPPSTWRQTQAGNGTHGGGSVKPPENRHSRFQQDEQPIGGDLQQQRPRAASLNPLIYPSWWGEDSDFEVEIKKRERSNDVIARRKGNKTDRQVEVNQPRQNLSHIRNEDTLERKLREAQDNKKKLLQQQQFTGSRNGPIPVNSFKTQPHRQDASPSYAYTSNKNAPKYSPLRNPNPGANNIPMSYVGPPSQAEINRNKGRQPYANMYDSGYGPNNDRQADYGRQNDNYNQQPRYQQQHDNHYEENTGGMMRGGTGGIMLSYSPPKDRNRNTAAVGHSKTAIVPKNKAAKHLKKPNTNSRNQMGNNYNNNTQQPPQRTLRPQTANIHQYGRTNSQTGIKKYNHVQSKIHDHIAYHKRVHQEKKQYEAQANRNVMNESNHKIDTRIYAKGPRPEYFPQNQQVLTTGANIAPQSHIQGAALRRRNSPLKEITQNEQPHDYQLQSSKKHKNNQQHNNNNERNQGQYNRPTSSYYHPYQHQTYNNYPNPASSDNQTDQFSMRNTQGQWPSSIENLNISNNRSTGQNFYGAPGTGTHQQQNRQGRNHFVGSGHEHTNGGIEKNEITQGLISSPIKSRYSESSPDRQTLGFGNTQHQIINGTTEPSMIKPHNQTRFGNGGNYYPGQNDSVDDQIIFRSDGFEQSRYHNNNQTVDQSRYSKHPFAQQNNTQYYNNPNEQTPYNYNHTQTQNDMNSSAFSGTGAFNQRPYQEQQSTYYHNPNNMTRQNPFTKNQQPDQSYLSSYPHMRHPTQTYEYDHINQNLKRPYDYQNDQTNGREREPKEQKNWVGTYQMSENQRLRDQQTGKGDMKKLAESNSYTYTLQNPINQERNTLGISPDVNSQIEEEKDSELSNYSPPEELQNMKNNNQSYIPDQPPQHYKGQPVNNYKNPNDDTSYSQSRYVSGAQTEQYPNNRYYQGAPQQNIYSPQQPLTQYRDGHPQMGLIPPSQLGATRAGGSDRYGPQNYPPMQQNDDITNSSYSDDDEEEDENNPDDASSSGDESGSKTSQQDDGDEEPSDDYSQSSYQESRGISNNIQTKTAGSQFYQGGNNRASGTQNNYGGIQEYSRRTNN
eukprot:403331881